jgi:hypothetical protein
VLLSLLLQLFLGAAFFSGEDFLAATAFFAGAAFLAATAFFGAAFLGAAFDEPLLAAFFAVAIVFEFNG